MKPQSAASNRVYQKGTHSHRSFQNISQLVLHRRLAAYQRSDKLMVHQAECGGRDGTACSCSLSSVAPPCTGTNGTGTPILFRMPACTQLRMLPMSNEY